MGNIPIVAVVGGVGFGVVGRLEVEGKFAAWRSFSTCEEICDILAR